MQVEILKIGNSHTPMNQERKDNAEMRDEEQNEMKGQGSTGSRGENQNQTDAQDESSKDSQ